MLTATRDVVKRRRAMQVAVAGVLAIAALYLAFWFGRRSAAAPEVDGGASAKPAVVVPPADDAAADGGTTQMWAHNLLLRKGRHFRIYLQWVRGQMVPTSSKHAASLDDPESFVLQIQRGVVDARLADVTDYLNSRQVRSSSLKDIVVENHDGELQIRAKAHKGIWLPVRLDGDLSPAPGGQLRFHLKKLNVLKLPMKGLFGLFHIQLADLLPHEPIDGMQLSGNDMYFNTLRLLPPPHAHGDITSVRLDGDHVRVLYGNAHGNDERMAQWHNFLQLTGGTVSFGKLTMHQTDLTLIDATDDRWFDLDLANYQAQLMYGTIRMTRKAGVEMYMPDLDHLPAGAGKASEGVSVDWLKNRNSTVPELDLTDAPKR